MNSPSSRPLQADKALAFVEAIKEAKKLLPLTNGRDHDEALNRLRDAEEAYQDYLYSQRP